MPPKFLFDISQIDLGQRIFDQQTIREFNPQRGDMEHLDGIVWADTAGRCVGYKDVKPTEFWCAGHIPGRPLFPGVLMIEAAAQLASFYIKKFMGWKGFVGFGGVDEVRFRQQVTPPSRLFILCERTWERHRRCCCAVQGIVNDGMVFEALITGVEF